MQEGEEEAKLRTFYIGLARSSISGGAPLLSLSGRMKEDEIQLNLTGNDGPF